MAPPAESTLAESLPSSADSFRKEPADNNRSESTTVTPPQSKRVSLGTLARNGIRLDNEEAIAIGRALCLTLTTAVRQSRPSADAQIETGLPAVNIDTVFLDPDSQFGVSVTDPGEEAAAIESVARILLEIAPSDALRVLRAVIAKALANPPQLATVAELSEAFAAFEQPQEKELIQAVYGRWNQVQLTTALRSRISPVSETRPTSRIRFGSQPRALAAAVIVVAILFAGVAATVLMRPSLAGADGDESAEFQLLDSRSMAWVMVAAMPSHVPFEPPAFSVEPAAVDRAEPPVQIARSAADARKRIPVEPTHSSVRAKSSVALPAVAPRMENVSPTPPRASESGVRGSTSMGVPDDTRVVTPPNSRAAAEPLKDGRGGPTSVRNRRQPPRIYSARDADVAPPIPILPRLLASLHPSSPGVRIDALAIAVVVDEQGQAYSVNGVNAPQNMGEYVLLTSALAAVKSWEFEPASKDGVPVRYRLIIPLRSLAAPAQ